MNIEVEIYLWGKDLLPEEVTKILKLTPVKTRTRGDFHVSDNGKGRVYEDGMWVYSTNNFVSSKNLRDHILFLERKIGGKIMFLKKKKIVENSRIYISVYRNEIGENYRSWEEELEPCVIKSLSKIGASLYFIVMM